jgi:hypothetical protein
MRFLKCIAQLDRLLRQNLFIGDQTHNVFGVGTKFSKKLTVKRQERRSIACRRMTHEDEVSGIAAVLTHVTLDPNDSFRAIFPR